MESNKKKTYKTKEVNIVRLAKFYEQVSKSGLIKANKKTSK